MRSPVDETVPCRVAGRRLACDEPDLPQKRLPAMTDALFNDTPPILPPMLLRHAEDLLAKGGRRLLGLAGAPGGGKSTLAGLLADALGERAVVVPMDGFHQIGRAHV